jgi:uncharacterized protein (TIGR03118 family)
MVRSWRPALEALEDRFLPAGGFVITGLVSDIPGLAARTDPSLVNPWGLVADPSGTFWIANAQTGISTLYNGAGQPEPLTITVGAAGGASTTLPTGTVFNGGAGFQVTEWGRSGASLFLFATKDGTIAGWNPWVDAGHAVTMVNASAAGDVFTGLALGDSASGTLLYAADFGNQTVAVFNQNFQPVKIAGGFVDPNLPTGFAPFNVQNVDGRLFVTYALQDAGRYVDVPGASNGFVDVFNTDGQLLQRFASGGTLNSPWGVALAPAGFGAFGNDVLIGNRGDGRIAAYDPGTGAFEGFITGASGAPVQVAGLWGLNFGTGASANTLYFTAGIGGEQHGLFGDVQASAASAWGSSTAPASQAPDISAELARLDPTPDGGDDYPIPPSAGPSARPERSIEPGTLPVLLPLGSVSTDPASGRAPGRDGDAGQIATDSARTGLAVTEAVVAVAASRMSGTHGTAIAAGLRGEGKPDQTAALDLVLSMAEFPDAHGQPMHSEALASVAGAYSDEGMARTAAVTDASARESPSAGAETRVVVGAKSAAPATAALATPLVTAGWPQSLSYRLTVLLFLSGIPLGWLVQGIARKVPVIRVLSLRRRHAEM